MIHEEAIGRGKGEAIIVLCTLMQAKNDMPAENAGMGGIIRGRDYDRPFMLEPWITFALRMGRKVNMVSESRRIKYLCFIAWEHVDSCLMLLASKLYYPRVASSDDLYRVSVVFCLDGFTNKLRLAL